MNIKPKQQHFKLVEGNKHFYINLLKKKTFL